LLLRNPAPPAEGLLILSVFNLARPIVIVLSRTITMVMFPQTLLQALMVTSGENHASVRDEIVLTMVDNNPGAIGIVNVYSIHGHVKVLKVDEKLPIEQGYPLHGN